MAEISDIRTGLAGQVDNVTGLRVLAEAKDAIQPPVAVILPGQPLIHYGDTLDGTFTVNLRILIMLSDAAPTEKVQKALDAYLGIGKAPGVPASIAGAIMQDPTLGGTVHFCVPVSVDSYNRVEYAGVTYFGARINVEIGAI